MITGGKARSTSKHAHLAYHAAEMDPAPLLRKHGGFLRRDAGLFPGLRVDNVGAICAAEILPEKMQPPKTEVKSVGRNAREEEGGS